MTWQDAVFLSGSLLSVLVLLPTLRDSTAKVPLGTALPSALLSVVYGSTFLSLGMTLSGVGSFLICCTWALIAHRRSPNPLARRANGSVADGEGRPTPTAD